MKRNTRRRWIGMLSLGLIAVAAIVVVLTVFAGTNDDRFTATGYSDVIRFAAEGVATLQVRIFDLSGKEVWDSGMISGDTVDWDRRNDTGERLAYGAYIYNAQGWNAQGDLNFQKNGKLALMPGDQVQLQAAPVATGASTLPSHTLDISLQPKEVINDNLTVNGSLTVTGIGSFGGGSSAGAIRLYGLSSLPTSDPGFFYYSDGTIQYAFYMDMSDGADWKLYDYTNSRLVFRADKSTGALHINPSGGNVGIGTSNITAKLTVQDSTGQDLIAAYNSSNRVFVVKSTGEVRADGAYYSGTGGFIAGGGADVAERINVSEWVEAGCVLEIDPDYPGFFRKSSSAYSTKVAGIISTSPGVILGNSFDEATNDWEDNRPVLAIAGRVPLQVTTENGSIQIGDLLVSSSTPGVAMKGDPAACVGAVIGKAMEPLENGTDTIVVQVMLR